MKVIKAKAKGKHVAEPKFKMVKSTAKDLMAQLKKSLEGEAPRKKAS
jgi:non-homologous end joining protein Ku